MITTTHVMLANVTYSGSSDVYGDPVTAANYYGGLGATQTAVAVTTDFVGTIVLEATLNDQPTLQAAWFVVDSIDATESPLTDTTTKTMIGNFCYMRVHVKDFAQGTVNSISLTY